MMSPRTKRVVTWLALLALGVLAFLLWSRRFPAKAKALAPVIAELESAHAAAGQYPTNVQSLASVQDVTRTYEIYFGERSETNLFWAAADISSHDLSILVGTNYFVLFAPTGRMKPWSFSSFPVWRRTHEDSDWRRGRIHWSLLGTYWSKN